MRLSIILFLVFISVADCFCQNQNSFWYFGDSAGIAFTSGGPIADTNGILRTQEASATISSKNGDLLFYVAGDRWVLYDSLSVRNQLHQLMPNGTGLIGYSSCTQGALILSQPGDSTKYYIISIENYQNSGQSHLYYSIIDMNLDSGKGDVLQKNILLSSVHFTEKLNAVKHANGRDWWVLAHQSNTATFFKFLLTPNGISLADTQSIGTVYSTAIGKLGQIVFSKQGNKLLCAGTSNLLDLFDFDRCTGVISNWIDLGILNHPASNSYYGCSFSLSGNRIYLSGVDSLFQFDVTASNIAASKTFMWQTGSNYKGLGQHLIGPDGKIYIAHFDYGDTTSKYIHVIDKPDDLCPACSFTPYSFYLGGRMSRFGLPNMPNYNLGRLIGSACDTVWTGVQNIEQAKGLMYVTYISDWQKLFLNAQGLKGRSFKVSVYDMVGNVIYTDEGKLSSQYFTRDLNMAAFAKGMYIVNFVTDKERLAKKFIKD